MEEQVRLPKVLMLRIERFLNRHIEAAYRTEDINVARVVFANNEAIYFDLRSNKEVGPTLQKVQIEGASELDTLVLTGKEPEEGNNKGNFSSLISRSNISSAEEVAEVEETQPVAKPKRKVPNTKKKK